MKQVIIFFLILMINTAQAQIFKCEAKTGQIIYQDRACNSSNKQRQIDIQDFDSNKTFIAQEKLSIELQQRKELKAIRDEQLLQERKINALNAQAISNQELADATRENAYATQQNTDAVKYRNSRSNVYYYNPRKHRNTKPDHKFRDRKKSKKSVDVRHGKNTVSHFNPPLRQPKPSLFKKKQTRKEDKSNTD